MGARRGRGRERGARDGGARLGMMATRRCARWWRGGGSSIVWWVGYCMRKARAREGLVVRARVRNGDGAV